MMKRDMDCMNFDSSVIAASEDFSIFHDIICGLRSYLIGDCHQRVEWQSLFLESLIRSVVKRSPSLFAVLELKTLCCLETVDVGLHNLEVDLGGLVMPFLHSSSRWVSQCHFGFYIKDRVFSCQIEPASSEKSEKIFTMIVVSEELERSFHWFKEGLYLTECIVSERPNAELQLTEEMDEPMNFLYIMLYEIFWHNLG
ncbi:hypothetical protein ACLOJK_005563 [Asimina triloba]